LVLTRKLAKDYQMSVAAQLGLAGVADFSTAFKARTFAVDIVHYTPV